MDITIREPSTGVFDVRVRPGRSQPPFYFRVGSNDRPATRRDAEQRAAKWTQQVALRPLHPHATLREWLLYMVANAHDLAPATLAIYRRHIRCWIAPERPGRWSLGAMQLRHITEADQGAFLAWGMDGCGCTHANRCRCVGGFRRPLKVRTVRDSIKLVRAALGRAVQYGMLPENPWEHAKLPRAARRPPATPGRDDLDRLADVPDARVRLLLMLAAHTGARRSELLALTWDQVDMKGGYFTIGASLDHQPGSLPVLKEPKTATGRRTVALPDAALSELRLARLEANAAVVKLERERLKAGAAPSVDQRPRIASRPVFANQDGSWWSPDAASQAALRALRVLGLPGSLHTLRHAHATLLLGGEGKVSPHVVSRRLGHANVGTTLSLYAHAIPADDKAAAEAVNRIFPRRPGITGTR